MTPSRSAVTVGCLLLLAGCLSPAEYREQADEVAADIIARKQEEALGRTEPFTIEPPADTLRRRLLLGQDLAYSSPASLGTDQLETPEKWPEEREDPVLPEVPPMGEEPFRMSLDEALQVGARNSRTYQDRKESVFQSALALDLERDQFRSTFTGLLDSMLSSDLGSDPKIDALDQTGTASVSKKFESGLEITTLLALDLVNLLKGDHSEALGILSDTTISLPLLRGAGREIVTEPMTQAERNVVYAIHTFERFKRIFAVQVATDYLGVLQQIDSVINAEENYRRLIVLTRRSRRLGDAGRLPEVQVDQAKQDELRARDRWIAARELYDRRLDSFKLTLGLPVDAWIELDRAELERLEALALDLVGTDEGEEERLAADAPIELVEPSTEEAGPLEMEDGLAIGLALENRLDLRTAIGRVEDAQRGVIVAADALQAGVDLVASGTFGERRSVSSADQSNAQLRPERGFYGASLLIDLPWERTRERNTYRNSLIALEQSARDVQDIEDSIKAAVRDGLRSLLQARETYTIQEQAERLADRRVESTNILLEAGRAEIRDLLEAQEALLSAQNTRTAALVTYRISALELQRDLGVLQVDETGLWKEYRPDEQQPRP